MNVVDVLPRDAIPSIDDPTFGDDYLGDPDDEVLVLEGDPPRAYPLRILNYHEVVNDVVPGAADPDPSREAEAVDGESGRPIAVTWCPICGCAVAYDRRVPVGGDGVAVRTLEFGVSGKLADDDLVLYDRETGSEWKQSTGECIAGELEGTRLTAVAAPTTTVAAFREAHPDGVLLQPVEGSDAAARGYDPSGYEAYADDPEFGLRAMRGSGPDREWTREDVDAKTVVVGLEVDGEAVGVPVPVLEAEGGVVETSVGGTEAVVVASAGLHAFEHPGFDLRLDADGALRGDGARWDPATGESDDGRRLARLAARRLYAFAWQDDHGPDAFYGL